MKMDQLVNNEIISDMQQRKLTRKQTQMMRNKNVENEAL